MENELDPQTLSPTKRALYELRNARARIEALERAQNEPIAIVGMGLRFPGGASDPETLWKVLREGRDTITEIPSDRWDIEQYYDADPDAPGKMYTRHGAFLDQVDGFDARFFGISPREATTMDPQQRLLLEVAWEALENAGHRPEDANGAAGVFVALSNSDYGRLVMGEQDEIDVYSSTGNNFSVAAGRLSYFLGLEGPSMVVDSACSGSLVAVHLASQSLRAGECRVALAGGVNLILSPEVNINFSKARMMAKDGRCKTFDASADGYVRGEGCGLVVLKRLSDAVADGDHVLAVIRGSAVNQDGQSGGLTVPNGPAQEAVIQRALASGNVAPSDVGYIEAHGTGTSLGDPIEAHALAGVFGEGRASDNPLIIGSLKTNLGHLEAAAGVAGLIKAVLALQHETIPPHLHFRQMNPHIDWGKLPVEVPVQARPWPKGAKRRIAGVSSFGFSGTNAHVIVEEAPAVVDIPETHTGERRLHLLTLSARTPAALDHQIEHYREWLGETEDDLADVCFTANVGRVHFSERAVFLGSTREAMRDALTRTPIARGTSESQPDVVFLFAGQGSQRPGMGKELYDTEPVFRQAVDECARILDTKLDRPLLEIFFGENKEVLDQTAYTQPAIFVLEWALAQLWKSWGIEPTAVFGHSFGEYAALCVAGVWSLEDGLSLIVERGRVIQALGPGGAMTVVQADRAKVAEAIAGLEAFLSIAAVNGPDNVVLSGRERELQQVEERLRAEGRLVTRLNVSQGVHSVLMEPIAGDFARRVAAVAFHQPRVTVISSVTGRATTLEELRTAEYWRRQVRESVQFQSGMEALAKSGLKVFLEIGPAHVLIGMGQQCIGDKGVWTPSLRKDRGELEQMLESLGALYVHGVAVDWHAFESGSGHRRVALPTYPFERQRYWFETVSAKAPIPAWETVCEAGAWQSRQGRLDLSLDRYRRGWEVLERLTNAYITAAFVKLGAFQSTGAAYTIDSLAEQTGIQPGFRKLIERWLNRLVGAGVLQRSGAGYSAAQPLQAIPIEPVLREAATVFGEDRIFLEYITSCGSQLAEYVTGVISTLETLFPGGSFERAENLYEHAPLSAYFAGIGRASLEALVRARRGAPIRAVEVGAGTGATTSALLPVLPPDNSVYEFTDLSDFFLNHAREKFARYGFVRYGHFNAEESSEAQGYPEGAYDVVVATNVLHATRDIRDTLRRTRALLAPGGMLLLCEVTTYLPWFDITTGLIEGWQLFEDGLRDDHPLLPASQWTSLLKEVGFEHVAAFPEAGVPAEVLGQHVILAQVPGQPVRRNVSTTARAAESTTLDSPPSTSQGEASNDLLRQLAEAPASDRRELLVRLIRTELARSLRVSDPESLERRRRLIEFGIDSLMAVELRNRLAGALKLSTPLPATLIFDHPSIEALAEYLERDVLGYTDSSASNDSADPSADAHATAQASATAARVSALEQLSEEEAEALLLRRLQSL